MATYLELYNLAQDGNLRSKCAVAVLVAVDTIRGEDAQTVNHANRLAWAREALKDPVGEGARLLGVALVQNKTLTTAQIQAATDAGLQSAIDSAINLVAG